jgi:hypothetical protein
MIVRSARTMARQCALMSRLRMPRPSLNAVRVAETGRDKQKLIWVAFKLTCAGTRNAIRPIARIHAGCTNAASVRMRNRSEAPKARQRYQRRYRESQVISLLVARFPEYRKGYGLDIIERWLIVLPSHHTAPSRRGWGSEPRVLILSVSDYAAEISRA